MLAKGKTLVRIAVALSALACVAIGWWLHIGFVWESRFMEQNRLLAGCHSDTLIPLASSLKLYATTHDGWLPAIHQVNEVVPAPANSVSASNSQVRHRVCPITWNDRLGEINLHSTRARLIAWCVCEDSPNYVGLIQTAETGDLLVVIVSVDEFARLISEEVAARR